MGWFSVGEGGMGRGESKDGLSKNINGVLPSLFINSGRSVDYELGADEVRLISEG